MAVDKTKWVRGSNLDSADFNFNDADNLIEIKTDPSSSVGQALAAYPEATIDTKGIVNLTALQVLGAGPKIIDGVAVSGNTVAEESISLSSGTNKIRSDGAVTIGKGASAGAYSMPGSYGVAVGLAALAGGGDVAIGDNSTANANADGDRTAVAIGKGSSVTHANSNAFGSYAVTTRENQVVLGNTDTETVETHGRVGAKGYMSRGLVGPGYGIDLSLGEYFEVWASAVSTEPTNFPDYAFFSSISPALTPATVVSILLKVTDDSPATGFWPGIQWENGIEPTFSGDNSVSLYGFIGVQVSPMAAVVWTGVTLASALS